MQTPQKCSEVITNFFILSLFLYYIAPSTGQINALQGLGALRSFYSYLPTHLTL